MRQAKPCICGKRMLELANEGTCLWCGYGEARVVVELAYGRNMDEVPAPATAFSALAGGRPRRGLEWTEDRCVEAAREWERVHGELPSMADWRRAKRPGERRPSYATVQQTFGGWRGFMNAIADVPREALAA